MEYLGRGQTLDTSIQVCLSHKFTTVTLESLMRWHVCLCQIQRLVRAFILRVCEHLIAPHIPVNAYSHAVHQAHAVLFSLSPHVCSWDTLLVHPYRLRYEIYKHTPGKYASGAKNALRAPGVAHTSQDSAVSSLPVLYSSEFFEAFTSSYTHTRASSNDINDVACLLPEMITWVELDADSEFAINEDKARKHVSTATSRADENELDACVLTDMSSSYYGLSVIGSAVLAAPAPTHSKHFPAAPAQADDHFDENDNAEKDGADIFPVGVFTNEYLTRILTPLLVVLLKSQFTAARTVTLQFFEVLGRCLVNVTS
jgi:hypothetical protein